MEIKILRSAQQDLVDAYYLYEQQRQGIGQYFLDNVYTDIESLSSTAGIHPVVFNTYHRLLAKKIPFCRLLQNQQPNHLYLRHPRLPPQPVMDKKKTHLIYLQTWQCKT